MANNSRVEVTLGFKGDMSQINKDLDSLTAKLRAMGQGKGILGGEQAITKEMTVAMNSASKLSTIMQKCRMDNGKLDVAAFKEALDKAGMSAKSLANDFKALGPQGVAAFNEIAKSVQTAQVPMQKAKGMLGEFATTLKNTAKWQISSTLLHGFMSSVSGAYHYAQDLNESLNNIRIVSKQNTDQMAEFAKEANKAAKELSVTTTAYTDAALIFYQQGLQGDAVTERADVVAKMSNVTRDSVDEVSSYMTAIWNNFDDGSQSIEHYADVITSLGAATASSSAEIAQGLEKFAAVADTVGLSYDYATSALATVVAQTRQSADTVGTAFKTLFARIEGLKLGETLDDGVDLNKYSEALNKVGVNVLNANGQLRQMDDILDDLGARWDQIDQASQVALAQTVAGTRQYNQLVALMDNWDKVQENLQVARSSDGELQAQADIYAESWEAAQKRVQTAAQTIYASLMDENFFISLANGTEKFLTVLGKVIDALGGLKGLWPLLMTGITKLFGGDLGLNLGNFIASIKANLDEAKGIFTAFKEEFVKEDITLNVKVNNNAMAAVMDEYKNLISTITETQQVIDKTDVIHQNLFNDILQRVTNAINAEVEARNALEESVQKYEERIQQANDIINGATQRNEFDNTEKITSSNDNNIRQTKANFEQTSTALAPFTKGMVETTEEVEVLNGEVKTLQQNLLSLSGPTQEFSKEFDEEVIVVGNVAQRINEVNSNLQNTDNILSDVSQDTSTIAEQLNSGFNPAITAIQQMLDNSSLKLQEVIAMFKEMQNGVEGTAMAEMGVNGYEELISQLNTIIEQIEEAEQGIGATDEQVAALSDTIQEIQNRQIAIQEELIKYISTLDLTEQEANDLNKIIEQLGKDTGTVSEKTEEVATAMSNVSKEANNAKQATQQLGNETDISKTKAELFAQSFSTVTMNASRFAMTITQINNTIEQLNDNSKSWGEKLLSVAMAAGMIGMSFKGTLGFFGDITRGASKLITLIADIVTGKTIELGITKAITKEEQKQEVSQGVQNKEQAAQNAQKGTQLTMQKLANGRNSFFPAATKEGTKAAGTGFFGKVGTAVTGAGGGTALTGTAATIAGVAAAVVAAVVVAAVIAKIAHEVAKSNAIKDFANKSKEQNEKQEKVTKNQEDLDKITEGYEEFHDAINSATLSTEEMRVAALKVAEATNDQRVAALALTGSFKELDAYLQKRTLEEQKEYLDSLNASNASSESTIQAGLIAEARKAGAAVDNFGKTFDIKSLNYFNPNGTGSDDKLGKLLQEVSGESLGWGQISTEALTKAVMGKGNNGMTSEEFLNELRNIVNMGGSGAAGAQQILDWAGSDEVKKYIDDYNNNLKEIESVGLENAFTKNLVGVDEIKNAQEYENILEQIKQTAKENGVDIEAPDFEEKLNSMAMSYQELQDMAATHAIVLQIQDVRPELEDKLKGLENQIKTFSDSERSWILLHPHIAADLVNEDGKIDDSSLKPIIDYAEDKNKYETLRGITDSYDANKGLDKETLAQLQEMGYNIYQNEYLLVQQLIQEEDLYYNKLEKNYDAASKLAAEKMEAAGQDEWYHQNYSEFGENANLIKQYYDGLRISIEHEGNDTKEALKQKNKEIIKATTEDWSGFDAYGENNINNDNFKKLAGSLGMSFQEATEYSDDGSLKATEEFTERWSEAVTNLTEKFDGSKESIEEYCKKIEKDYDKTTADMVKANLRVTKSLDEHISVWEEAASLVEEASKTEGKTAVQRMKDAENAVISCSKALDTLQASYKTLKSAMAEYNEQGSLNLDSVQALVALGPAFISQLTDANGQLQLNEESIEAATEAYLRQLEAQQAKVLMEQIEIITDTQLTDKEKQKALAAYEATNAIAAAGYTMKAVAKAATDAIPAHEAYRQSLEGIRDAANGFSAVFNAGQKGLKSNFPRFMGVSSKGGGSKKEKEKKDFKEYADEFDRFYPFQKVIDDLADAISDLAKEQEHLAGGELVGSIRYQNKLLQEQKKAYQELAKEQKKYQKEMQVDLAKYGMSFDTASGNIVNYAQSTQAMLDRYNAAIEKYNKSAQSDADKKTLEAVEKEYEKFKKLVSNYQGILTEIQDTENNLDDIYYETIANNLKEFEIMVQVKLDIGEARRMVNDFINEINKNFKTLRKTTEEWMSVFDNALKNAHTYIDGDLGTINVDLDALNKVKSAIDSGDYGHEGAMFVSETEAITKYKELAEQLKDDSKELYDLYKEAWEDYLDAVDDAIEQWEEIINNFDDINDTLDHYEKMIELLHDHQDTDQGYDELINLYNKQMELQLAKQATLKKQIDTLQSEYKELIASGANEYDEDVKKIQSSIKDANKALQGSLEAYVETMNKAFEKQANKAIDDYVNNMLGFNLNDYTEQWAREKKAMEGYYDVNERVMQIDRIRRKYNEAIAKTVDIKQQEKLAKLRDEELADLEKADKLAEKRVELSEKKLAVTQAEIALEEARDNKSQMRLQRDSQGNWNYQFVANDDDILDKEQNLADAVYDQYETSKQWAEKLFTEDIPNLANDLKEELSQIMSDTTLTAEEKSRKIQEVSEYYQNLIKEKAKETETARKELNEATAVAMIDMDQLHDDNFGVMNEHQQDLVKELTELGIQSGTDVMTAIKEDYDEIIKKADESNQQTMAGWNLLEEAVKINSENMAIAQQEFYDEIKRLNEEYDEAIRRSEEASGIAWSNIGFAIELAGDEISEVTSKIDECVEHSQALSDFRERVNDIESAWMGVRQSIVDALGSLDDYMQRLLEVREMQEEVKRNETEATGSAEIDIATGEPMGKGGGTPYSPSYTTPKSTFSYNMYGSTGTTWTNNQTKKEVSAPNLGRNFGAAKVSGVAAGAKQLSTPIVVNNVATSSKASSSTYNVGDNPYREDTWAYKLREKLFGSRFASGGYTGEWGSDPRLALLDQKELVLNASDTSKILDTVKIVRDMNSSNNEFISYLADIINQSTDALAQAMESGINILGERMAYTSDRVASALLDAGSRQLEQNVHIDASFPNVSDRHEIEDAFNNLVNIASQRALASDVLISDSYLI